MSMRGDFSKLRYYNEYKINKAEKKWVKGYFFWWKKGGRSA